MDFIQKIFLPVNKYNIYLIIPIGLLCYFLILKLNAKLKKKIYETMNIRTKGSARREKDKEENYNSKLLRKYNDILRKQGYPLGLNAYGYFTAKSCLFLLCFAAGLRNYQSIWAAAVIGLLGFFIIDIYIYLNKFIRNNAINNDLLNAVDGLRLQMSAHVSLRDALRGLHEVCRNRDLKKALITLAARYELTEYNIDEAVHEFKESFEILEADMFAAALKQQVESGASIEVLNNLSEILKEGYLDKLNLHTKVKILYIMFGVSVILFNLILLTFFPIFVDVSENMKEIFR